MVPPYVEPSWVTRRPGGQVGFRDNWRLDLEVSVLRPLAKSKGEAAIILTVIYYRTSDQNHSEYFLWNPTAYSGTVVPSHGKLKAED